MSASRRYLMLLAIVLIVALPGGGAYLYYYLTDDPLLQPLGLTRERLAEIEGQTEFLSIMVHVDWGQDRAGGITQVEFRDLLRVAFSTRTDEIVFKFNDVPGHDIAVTYVVGPNRFGPYAPGEMVQGIHPSWVAFEMTKKFHARREALAQGQ